MKRKLSGTIVLVVLASLLTTVPTLAAKSYYAERFDVQIEVQEAGSAVVTETVEIHFSGDPFTFAFREISATETDGITFLDASMDGVPMPRGTQAGQVEVETGDPLRVTWHFPPVSDAAHTFTVRYRTDGVIRKGDADTLIWRAIPEDHDYSITQTRIILTFPLTATLLEQPTLNRSYESEQQEDRILLTASGLAEDEDLVLTARFSPGSLTQTTPRWQVQQEKRNAAAAKALPFAFLAGIATLLFGGLGLLVYTRSNARELNVSPIVSTAYPPSDTPAAVVGKLTGQQHTFMGAIFDLAGRGILEIREEAGFWGSSKYILVYKDRTASLRLFEQALMDLLFKADEPQINLNDAATKLGMKKKLFDEQLEKELIQRDWLDVERKGQRTRVLAVGLVLMFISIAAFFLSLILGGWSTLEDSARLPWVAVMFGISAGLFIVSIPLLIYGATYSVLTPGGEEQSVRWKGFAEYIKLVSKGSEPAISPDFFEKYLAYAAVFGLGKDWAKYFQNLGGMPLPAWFHTMAGSDDGFSGIVAVMIASDTAGVSASGGDGGAGASGGGSSGAG